MRVRREGSGQRLNSLRPPAAESGLYKGCRPPSCGGAGGSQLRSCGWVSEACSGRGGGAPTTRFPAASFEGPAWRRFNALHGRSGGLGGMARWGAMWQRVAEKCVPGQAGLRAGFRQHRPCAGKLPLVPAAAGSRSAPRKGQGCRLFQISSFESDQINAIYSLL